MWQPRPADADDADDAPNGPCTAASAPPKSHTAWRMHSDKASHVTLYLWCWWPSEEKKCTHKNRQTRGFINIIVIITAQNVILQSIYKNSLNLGGGGGGISNLLRKTFSHMVYFIYVSLIDGIVAHEPNHLHGRNSKQWTSGTDSGRLYIRAGGNEQSL